MTQDAFQPGEIARVSNADESDTKVMVLEVYETRQDEKRVKWDFNQNPVYVYDYDENQAYDPSAPVVGAVYLDALKKRGLSWASMSVEDVRAEIEGGTLREYHFPLPRLDAVDAEGSVAYQ